MLTFFLGASSADPFALASAVDESVRAAFAWESLQAEVLAWAKDVWEKNFIIFPINW